MDRQSPLLTREQAMHYLGIGNTTFNTVRKSLKCRVIGGRKKYHIKDLDNYLNEVIEEPCQNVELPSIRTSQSGNIQARFGTLTSRTMGSELDAALKQAMQGSPKSSPQN